MNILDAVGDDRQRKALKRLIKEFIDADIERSFRLECVDKDTSTDYSLENTEVDNVTL